MSGKGNRRATENLKLCKNQLGEMVEKVDRLEELFQEYSNALLEDADSIRDAAKTTSVLFRKFHGAAQEVTDKRAESSDEIRDPGSPH